MLKPIEANQVGIQEGTCVGPVVGIIANPVSARDIRRVVTDASSLQTADRAGIVLRVAKGLAATGVEQVLLMPDKLGIRGHVERQLRRVRISEAAAAGFPRIDFLDMPVLGSVADTLKATRMMVAQGASAIVVLGGDGTHRAVADACGSLPIAGISTGTNNAFPRFREATAVGFAVGLSVGGRVPDAVATRQNKVLKVEAGDWTEIALVDVAIVTDRYAGARALWRSKSFRELYCAFAEPGSVGMSAIAALVDPISREESAGVGLLLAAPEDASRRVLAPIAPGIIEAVGLKSIFRMLPDRPIQVGHEAGSIAFDGERERVFGPGERITVSLQTGVFRTIDVEAVLQFAACHGLLIDDRVPTAARVH